MADKQEARRLQVAPDGHHLQYENGASFFYLGDTAWDLFHGLNREDAELYLNNRAEKGFTVIQTVALAEMGPHTSPNPYGDLALIDRDPTRPNESYFRHVDYIVDKAEALGLVVGFLPTWGSYWKIVGMDKAPTLTAANAGAYGRFLGERYRDKPVIWILGGDRAIESDEERSVMDTLAEGLDAGDGGSHLMTYHPRGPGCSSDYFHNTPWLDFNMIQSSHGAHDHDNGMFVERDYALQPAKPTLDGEPRYETLQVGFYFREANRYDRFDDYDVRQAAYWSVLAGACGFTYGNNSVFQMWTPARRGGLGVCIPWQDAIDHPGAFQMGHMRRFFEAHAFDKLVPAPQLVLDGPNRGGGKVRAAMANDGSLVIGYSPRGERFTLDKSVVSSRRVRESWFDPRYGCTYPVHITDNCGYQTYTPPTSGRGNDWCIVLEGVADDAPPIGPGEGGEPQRPPA